MMLLKKSRENEYDERQNATAAKQPDGMIQQHGEKQHKKMMNAQKAVV